MAKIKGTLNTYPLPVRKTRWVGIIFFIILHLVGVVGTPLYWFHRGISAGEWALFGSYFVLTNLAITVGYHRLFSHACYKANPIVRFLLLFFGAATFEQSALKWSSQHRQHHQFTDTDQDPYNIKRGFWYAHMNWILLYKHRVNYDNVKDLRKSKLVMNQHHLYSLWSVGAGILVPMLIGVWMGHPLGAFIMAVSLRIVLVMHSAFFINSWAHMFGTTGYDGTISAKDNFFGVFLTNGEGYHNFHHKFPTDYRNGIRWYDWDPSKWMIYGLSLLGFTWDLKRTPKSRLDAYSEAAA